MNDDPEPHDLAKNTRADFPAMFYCPVCLWSYRSQLAAETCCRD